MTQHVLKTEDRRDDWTLVDVVCSCGWRKTVHCLDHGDSEEVYYFIRAVKATHIRMGDDDTPR